MDFANFFYIFLWKTTNLDAGFGGLTGTEGLWAGTAGGPTAPLKLFQGKRVEEKGGRRNVLFRREVQYYNRNGLKVQSLPGLFQNPFFKKKRLFVGGPIRQNVRLSVLRNWGRLISGSRERFFFLSGWVA